MSYRFTEAQIRNYVMAGLQPDTTWQEPVGRRLREMGRDVEEAMAASDSQDWAAVLRAVRLIQGRAVVTRGLLECMLGQDAEATEPPLVRVFGEIRRLISDREVDSLPPDMLRARIHAILQALDRELKMLLSPPDEPSRRTSARGSREANKTSSDIEPPG